MEQRQWYSVAEEDWGRTKDRTPQELGSAGLSVGSGSCDNTATSGSQLPQAPRVHTVILMVHPIGWSGMRHLSISEPVDVVGRGGAL